MQDAPQPEKEINNDSSVGLESEVTQYFQQALLKLVPSPDYYVSYTIVKALSKKASHFIFYPPPPPLKKECFITTLNKTCQYPL